MGDGGALHRLHVDGAVVELRDELNDEAAVLAAVAVDDDVLARLDRGRRVVLLHTLSLELDHGLAATVARRRHHRADMAESEGA